MHPPDFSSESAGRTIRLVLTGSWTVGASSALERGGAALVERAGTAEGVILDLRQIERLDTAGAWLVERTRRALEARGIASTIEEASAEHRILFAAIDGRDTEILPPRREPPLIGVLADVGKGVADFVHDVGAGVTFLGEFVAALGRVALHPRRFRLASLVHHLEAIAFRGAPIIALINFLVGAIVAQQGIYQLRLFGAVTLTARLIGLLILRELGVLLTAIMIAGRSGSAITAEIGSMKMREEIDALRVMGLSPMETLVVPRLLALVISLPILTFVADIAAIFGGLVTGMLYAGLSPSAFLSQLQAGISAHIVFVGLSKAPIMGLVIGLIAAVEGLKVEGSAESLGRQVTASVVKSIFMVIVLDGLFAVFFAGIQF